MLRLFYFLMSAFIFLTPLFLKGSDGFRELTGFIAPTSGIKSGSGEARPPQPVPKAAPYRKIALVVEDEKSIRTLYLIWLKRMEMFDMQNDVTEAKDGKEGLASFERFLTDLEEDPQKTFMP